VDVILPNQFRSWIENESEHLLLLVEDLTELERANHPPPRAGDERALISIGADEIIGEPKRSLFDVAGRLTTRFYHAGDRFLGLTGDNLKKVLKFSETVANRKELRDILSPMTVQEVVLDWIGARVLEREIRSLADQISAVVTEHVRPLTVWVPIEDTSVECELSFADAILTPLSRRELDYVIDEATRDREPEDVQSFRKKSYRDWLGKAIMRFSIEAEPRRARELALEKAERYMALLQFYGPTTMILPITSHAAPSGKHPHQLTRSMALWAGSLELYEGLSNPPTWLDLTHRTLGTIEEACFWTLSFLAKETGCDYERKLMESLLIYGRACYQSDPVDKLLQIITSVEMFVLRDANEPIMSSVGDRIAFAVSKDPDQRRSIARNFRTVYSLRSGRTHHGRTISEVNEIEEFLGNIWAFWLVALRGVGRYKERIDLIDDLDARKYGRT
jgi:hypothetical protein